MPTYDPAGHALLSQAAQRLEVDDLEAQADAAEAALDAALAGRGYGSLTDAGHESGTTEYDRAVMAVAYQVNYQVEAGTDGEVYKQQGRGDRSATFWGGSISQRALDIARQLVSGPSSRTWPTAGGLR